MKIQRTLLLTALVATLPVAARSAEHPRMYFRGGDVAALRDRAQTTHRDIADGLKRGTAEFHSSAIDPGGTVRWPGRTFHIGDVRDVGNALVVFSFTAALDPSPANLALAKGWLLTAAGWGTFDLDGQRDLALAHTLGGAAIAYDLLHASLSDAERAKVRDAIAREAERAVAAARSGLWWADSHTQNHNWINHAAIGLAAIALEGEVDAGRTRDWLALAVANAKKISAAIDGIADGTWHEGYSYLSYGLQWHLPFVEALRRTGGEDLTDLPLLRGLGAARAAAQIPEAPHTFVLASGDFNSFTTDEGLLGLRFAASRYQDGVAQAAADRWTAGTARKTYAPEANQQVFEYLFFDPAVPAADLSAQPLDWYGADLQAAIFRSSWEKGGTIFALKSGAMGGRSVWEKLAKGDPTVGALNFSHDHADDNGFYLYANGAWAAPEAQGYFIGHRDSPGPQANQTSFHNSMLVDGQGQLGSGVRESGDNGQSYPWFFQREGAIPFTGSSTHYGFATGVGEKLYDRALGVEQWDRHALFLDREQVVLFDVVKASQPRTWTWLSHFTGSATLEGNWIHGRGEDGQALGVAILSPTDTATSFWSASPVKGNKFVADGSFVTAEVKSRPATEAAFLTALVPVPEAGWAQRAKVEAIPGAGADAGLVLTDGPRRSTAVFARDGQGVKAGATELAGLAGVHAEEGGALARALLVRGSSLAKDGQVVLAVEGGTELLEADGLAGDVVTLSGKELAQARVLAPAATKVLWYGKDVPFRREGGHVVVELARPIEGAPPAGDATAPGATPAGGGGEAGLPVTEGSAGGGGGGGCASVQPGDATAVALVLLALALVARARRRPAVHAEVRSVRAFGRR